MIRLDPEIEAKYEVLAKMGEGGMGSVYKVRHRHLGEVQVIKTAKYSEGNTAEKSRFISEAKRGRALKHRNIAEVYDFAITADATAYIVMEFIDGLNLRQVLENSGRSLPASRVIDLALQALDALQYLGERNIVHRDISPDNLMLTTDAGGNPLVKMIDLGIAKSLEASQSFTLAGKFIGKFNYASPEQFGATNVDARSDLYSLGVVIYELLTGVLPVRSKDYRAVIMAHLSGDLLSFDETDPEGHVPANLRAVIMQSMRPEVTDRYQTANDFAAALRELGNVVTDKTTEVSLKDLAEVKLNRSEQIAWESARAADSPKAFDSFLERYPASPRANEARRRLEELEQIEEDDWAGASKADTAEALTDFLQKHPDSARVRTAKRRLEKIEAETAERNAFDAAVKTDTAQAWEQFIRNHPDAKRIGEARENLAATRGRETEARAWSAAMDADTSASWRDYINRHGRSQRVAEANQRLAAASEREDEEREWTAALSANTIAKWQGFIKNHPKSARRAEADAKLAALLKVQEEQRAFAEAERNDTVDGWQEYIRLYGKSPRAADAAKRLAQAEEREVEHRDWINAGAVDTVDAWRDYIAKHPAGRVEEARRRLLAAKRAQEEAEHWAEAEDVETSATWRGYLAQFSNSHRAAEARKRLAAAEERERIAAETLKSEEEAFESAERANTIEAWDEFIRRHPNSTQISAALQRLTVVQERVEKQQREDEARLALAEEQAWIRAEYSGSIDAFEQFLAEWPSSTRAPDARKQIEQARATLDRDEAVRIGTPDAYEHFLGAHPRSRYAKEIQGKLDSLRAEQRRSAEEEAERARTAAAAKAAEERAWTSAKKGGSAASLEEFIVEYGESNHVAEARQLIEGIYQRDREAAAKAAEERAWTSAKKRGGVASLQEFIVEYGESDHVAEARQLIEGIHQREREAAAAAEAAIERAWAASVKRNSIAEFEKFIAAHPQSEHVAEAQRLMAAIRAAEVTAAADALEREWRATVAARSIARAEKFISAHPKSERAKDARQFIEDLRSAEREAAAEAIEREWKAAVATQAAEPLEKFVAAHPDSPHVREARAGIKAIQTAERERLEKLAKERLERTASDYDWSVARNRNSIADYEQFIVAHPDSEHVKQARTRIEEIQRGERERVETKARDERESAERRAAQTTDATIVEPQSPRNRVVRAAAAAFIGLTVLVLVVIFAQRLFVSPPTQTDTTPTVVATSTAAAPGMGQLLINAFPWGQVTSIKEHDTQKEQLTTAQALYTPTTVPLPPGTYTVTLSNPNSGQSVTREVTVRAFQTTRCEAQLDTVDPNEYLGRVTESGQ